MSEPPTRSSLLWTTALAVGISLISSFYLVLMGIGCSSDTTNRDWGQFCDWLGEPSPSPVVNGILASAYLAPIVLLVAGLIAAHRRSKMPLFVALVFALPSLVFALGILLTGPPVAL